MKLIMGSNSAITKLFARIKGSFPEIKILIIFVDKNLKCRDKDFGGNESRSTTDLKVTCVRRWLSFQ